MVLLSVTFALFYAISLFAVSFFHVKITQTKSLKKRLNYLDVIALTVGLAQSSALLISVAYSVYKLHMDGLNISVPAYGIAITAILLALSLAADLLFWFLYRKKYFPETLKSNTDEHPRDKTLTSMAKLLTVAGSTLPLLNALYNLMFFAVISQLLK